MSPSPTAPCSLAGLLAEFRTCFTAPTFQTFVGLVVGLIAQTRRRTVCGMFTGAGLDRVWHHSRAHRLFAVARWSTDSLAAGLTPG
jgi:hypothetical protein